MKETLLTTFLVLVLVVPGFASDFRRAEWGMTREQVKATEEGDPSSRAVAIIDDPKDRSLLYRTAIKGFETSIWYEFEADRLLAGSYSFTSVDPDRCSEFFDELVQTVSKKYGNAKVKNIWRGESNRSLSPIHLSKAVIEGSLKRIAEWTTQRTLIKLELHSERYGQDWSKWSIKESTSQRPPHLSLYYYSKEYSGQRRQEKEKPIEDIF